MKRSRKAQVMIETLEAAGYCVSPKAKGAIMLGFQRIAKEERYDHERRKGGGEQIK